MDLLRQSAIEGEAQVEEKLLYRGLRSCMGAKLFDEQVLGACGGFPGFLGVAARHVKIKPAPHDASLVVLLDCYSPFHKQQDNGNYFARASGAAALSANCGSLTFSRRHYSGLTGLKGL